jgi:hypothetical protein
MQTRILHHGRRPRPIHIPKMRRADIADLLARLLELEAGEDELIDDDPERARYLDGLAERATGIALASVGERANSRTNHRAQVEG